MDQLSFGVGIGDFLCMTTPVRLFSMQIWVGY